MPVILEQIISSKKEGKRLFAVLIDPEKVISISQILPLLDNCENCGVDFIFIGGSTASDAHIDNLIQQIKCEVNIPVIIFPGSHHQISDKADALLFLSLISGRNPEYLIGQQVQAASKLKDMNLEVIPTGYLLVDGGKMSSVVYVSQTQPIPRHKNEIALNTALAGEFLGMKLIYLDSGSGARFTVNPQMIKALSSKTNSPLIVGGGIRNEEVLKEICEAGADVIVIGNALEKDPNKLSKFASIIHGAEVMN